MSDNRTWLNSGVTNGDGQNIPVYLQRRSALNRISSAEGAVSAGKTLLNKVESVQNESLTLLNGDSPLQNVCQTRINQGVSGQTILNDYGSVTSRRRRSNRATSPNNDNPSIDTNAGTVIELHPGDQLQTNSGNILTIQSRIGNSNDNGEADVFRCIAGSTNLVIKLFRRAMRNVEKKLEAFQKVKSRNIAPIVDYGFYVDRYYEVYYYYAYGSLADELKNRRFSCDELHDIIVPQLATAINDLHKAGIYHRDIKPGNILWSDAEKKGIVLIDFGLSSILRDPTSQATILVTQVGGTRAYEAPEVHDGLYLKESDYFSMGIVLYELFCGKTPTAVYTNRIIRPQGMDENLHNLILGLTYTDITNRNNKNNTNRRWTYEEIVRWFNGEKMVLPGAAQVIESAPETVNARSIPPFAFMGKNFEDIDSLCLALGTDWENGKRCILRDERNALLQHLRRYGKTKAHTLWASQIDDIINNNRYSPDQKLIHVIMTLSPNHDYIACPIGCFSSTKELGKRLMACMRNDSSAMRSTAADAMKTLLSTDELSAFSARHKYPQYFVDGIKWFERQTSGERWERQKESITYELAFFLSGDSILDVHLPDGTVFSTVDELKAYLLQFGSGDFKELYDICKYFLDDAHQMKPQVYGWLRQQGCPLDDFNQ